MIDFVSDWVIGSNQEKVRIINIVDEGSRKALWTEAFPNISAQTLIEVLNQERPERSVSILNGLSQSPNSMNRSRIDGMYTIPLDPTVQSGIKPPMNLKS